jgi:hypothetical protein
VVGAYGWVEGLVGGLGAVTACAEGGRKEFRQSEQGRGALERLCFVTFRSTAGMDS